MKLISFISFKNTILASDNAAAVTPKDHCRMCKRKMLYFKNDIIKIGDLEIRQHLTNIKTPIKYYFEDVGLRNVRLGFRQTEEKTIVFV